MATTLPGHQSHDTQRSINAQPNLRQALKRLAIDVEKQMQLQADLHEELQKSRYILNQLTAQRKTILDTSTTAMTQAYHSVIGYGAYLDERIICTPSLRDLRYDYDDMCESGFNLKLLAGALEKLNHDQPLMIAPISLAILMEQTLITLSSSLDRRAMKLTTAEVDESVIVTSDATVLSHVIWMMLLGMIQYAADETTLRMRCFYDQAHENAIMSIVISELAPGKMTPDERMAHIARQMYQEHPHMFAGVISVHANIQLATLLLQKINASITTFPLSSYACEIRVTIPV